MNTAYPPYMCTISFLGVFQKESKTTYTFTMSIWLHVMAQNYLRATLLRGIIEILHII